MDDPLVKMSDYQTVYQMNPMDFESKVTNETN